MRLEERLRLFVIILGVASAFLSHSQFLWCQFFAQLGSVDAETKEGLCYLNGNDQWGVKKDYQKAFPLLVDAAWQGNVRAESALAFMYAEGYGVSKNKDMAIMWYQKAADAGYPDAIIALRMLR